MSDSEYSNNNSQVTPEEMETILMLTRKMDSGDSDERVSSPEHESTEGVANKRKRGRPQRALSSAVPLVSTPAIQRSSNMELRNKDNYYYDDRSSSSEDAHTSHNSKIMSIQSMLNNSGNIPRQEPPKDDEDYTEKSWRATEKKRKDREDIKGSYTSNEYNNSYADQSWQDTLDKAVKGKQEKDMLDELAAILELPTKNFPHNTARLLYAKLEALKLLRETCNRGLITEELYCEKQQEFLDSMQF